MNQYAHFAVDPRLATLLGETYRSTEAALKELVDNSWDADAENVWITLPEALSKKPIVIMDDGLGMTSDEVCNEYLKVARDRRSRKGERSERLKRRIKGRKGIGKFAGLAAAEHMQVDTISGKIKTSVTIDKSLLENVDGDLERIPLPITQIVMEHDGRGTTVTLSRLNQALSFPNPEQLRSILVFEYGREQSINIYVNGRRLDVEDVPGETTRVTKNLSHAGEINMHLTIAQGTRLPRHPGILLKVSGKAVGRPQWFGLDEDPELPPKLRSRVYGEIEAEGIDEFVTSDWGAVQENSKAYQEISAFARTTARDALEKTYKRDIDLQKSRLDREIKRRIERLPAHRRPFAEEAVGRVLRKFYGDREDRVATAASVILDAMEQDEYWLVLRSVDVARKSDVVHFAEALSKFGLLEMALMSERATHRLKFLEQLDLIASNPKTLESQMHQVLERSTWIFGAKYHLMASNETLSSTISKYTTKKFSGRRSKNRPDLLLNTDPGDRYLLIEFKRPSHTIVRKDEAQAQEYRDDLSSELPAKPMDVILIGGKRDDRARADNDPPNFSVRTYTDVIAQSRYEIEWLVRNLAT